jgi:hypothetical protein
MSKYVSPYKWSKLIASCKVRRDRLKSSRNVASEPTSTTAATLSFEGDESQSFATVLGRLHGVGGPSSARTSPRPLFGAWRAAADD